MALSTNSIFDFLTGAFPELTLVLDEATPAITVPATAVKDVALQLRDHPDLAFDFLMCLSGMDYADGTLGVAYHLASIRHKHKLSLKVVVPKDAPTVATVEKVWRTADWHEREAFDLYGIIFDGHRDLRRILMPYDWEGHPLRKDYQVPEYYNGMKVPY
jgi:NADH-quinone oxidoreductase subunit C